MSSLARHPHPLRRLILHTQYPASDALHPPEAPLRRTAPATLTRDELRNIVEEPKRFSGGPEEIACDERACGAPVQQAFTVSRWSPTCGGSCFTSLR